MDTAMRPGWEQALRRLPSVDRDCERAAEAVAEDAREHAPRGAAPDPGAEGIHHEPSPDGEPATYRVSWEAEEFYMLFNEVGTEHQPARPFLRPAADAPSHRNQ